MAAIGTAQESPPEKASRLVPGYWWRRVKGKRRITEWRAVPGYEARRFKAGARVVRALKGLPWWAKAAPAVAAVALVVTLCASRVAGNPASQGGFHDTETVSVSFEAGTWGCGGHGGCSGGHGGCCSGAVDSAVYGNSPADEAAGGGEGGQGGNGGPGENAGDGNSGSAENAGGVTGGGAGSQDGSLDGSGGGAGGGGGSGSGDAGGGSDGGGTGSGAGE